MGVVIGSTRGREDAQVVEGAWVKVNRKESRAYASGGREEKKRKIYQSIPGNFPAFILPQFPHSRVPSYSVLVTRCLTKILKKYKTLNGLARQKRNSIDHPKTNQAEARSKHQAVSLC